VSFSKTIKRIEFRPEVPSSPMFSDGSIEKLGEDLWKNKRISLASKVFDSFQQAPIQN